MLSEIFPEDLEVIFAYLPTLTLEQIEKGQFYLTVTKELDRLAKNIFLRDLEDWAKIEIKESRFKELKESFNKYRSEIFIFSLAIAVFVPLIGSYIALSSTNSELSKENILLKTKHKELELKANQFEERSKFLERENIKLVEENGELIGENSELENELRTERSAMASIEKRVNREMNTLQLQELNDEILTLRNSLGKCESEKENISIQRQKLSVGYKWYKDLYNSCQEGRK
jgi:DNA repair exonuclease SbcCD ATPase subunit